MKSKIYLVVFFIFVIILVGCSTFTENESASKSSDKDGENYPERPIDVVIPYAAGGSADLQARIISDYMKNEFDQTINVVAKGGGAGSTGMNYVKSAKADGHTIILTAVGPSTLTPNSNDVGYNVTDDFEQISQISQAPYGIAVNSSLNVNSLEELFNMSKDKEVTYGTTGAGLHQHVVTSALVSELNDVNMEHVPFEGGAEAVSALLGNHVIASVNTISELLPHQESGDIKILAVTSEERLEELPDVPTFKELGHNLIGNGAWFGFMAPKDTPKGIVNKLDETIKKALSDEKVKEQFENAGLPIEYLNNEEFTEKVKEENEKNAKVIESLDL
ncbi:tripartite tricarboxylate transporter substrate binding protein [Virgibacillus halodenitrificans]|uniref:Tripartite tricarboxylate transporter substrate binding protein n=1 Tax=Virgibacillus halodenitrificans TaxID=1482 RepID=A0ABR7VJ17_VIRHA|nr:tripartite tricarboxylate transporter substrate binding protein [Virgibacillus halodenitrificans]MBD1221240.1 tripartite tricarboxylate transporter substrate binding protein [Virgibacillus halodenitrificans]MCJ0929800.1 tripartite tricarboxylate transporter substrate binding protein [Virgibacillus halodenitrificans]